MVRWVQKYLIKLCVCALVLYWRRSPFHILLYWTGDREWTDRTASFRNRWPTTTTTTVNLQHIRNLFNYHSKDQQRNVFRFLLSTTDRPSTTLPLIPSHCVLWPSACSGGGFPLKRRSGACLLPSCASWSLPQVLRGSIRLDYTLGETENTNQWLLGGYWLAG